MTPSFLAKREVAGDCDWGERDREDVSLRGEGDRGSLRGSEYEGDRDCTGDSLRGGECEGDREDDTLRGGNGEDGDCEGDREDGTLRGGNGEDGNGEDGVDCEPRG